MKTNGNASENTPSKARDGLLERSVKVLRVISTFPQGIGLSELARLSEVPKATCFRITSTLEEQGLLTSDEDTKRVRISVGSLSIIGGLLTQGVTIRAIREVLSNLSEESGETTGFDMLQDSDIIVLMQNVGPSLIGQTLKTTPRIQPPWLTSTGKSLLSYRSRDEVRTLLRPGYPEDKYDELESFIDAMEPAKVHGYAWLYGALEREAASVAAPVFLEGLPKYAVWIGGPTYRIKPDTVRHLGQMAIRAADQISNLLTVADQANTELTAHSFLS